MAFSVSAADSFSQALDAVRAVSFRPEISVEEAPAPQRLAPHAIALTAEILDDDNELATGRFVLLHDPDGVDEWQGCFRVVAFFKAELDTESATDPLISDVAWSWLTEELESVGVAAMAGTVTRTSSTSFGVMSDRPMQGHVELRASWTPTDAAIDEHVYAWANAMATAAGLLPVPQGVAFLPVRRTLRS